MEGSGQEGWVGAVENWVGGKCELRGWWWQEDSVSHGGLSGRGQATEGGEPGKL